MGAFPGPREPDSPYDTIAGEGEGAYRPMEDARAALLERHERTSKPRTAGLTIILDTGLGVRAIRDLAEVAGDHVDYAKIAWGSALITGNLQAKVALYRELGIVPLLGGTLFEYAHLYGKVEELLGFVRDTRLHVEISDGVVNVPRSEKLRWIEAFARVTEVFSEVGGKVESQNPDWSRQIPEELSAGAARVVIEGREVGPVGQEIREEVVDAVLAAAPVDKLVFEALERKQQVWLIKKLGLNVNLANVRPAELLTLESFRLGLKEHTLLHTRQREEP